MNDHALFRFSARHVNIYYVRKNKKVDENVNKTLWFEEKNKEININIKKKTCLENNGKKKLASCFPIIFLKPISNDESHIYLTTKRFSRYAFQMRAS